MFCSQCLDKHITSQVLNRANGMSQCKLAGMLQLQKRTRERGNGASMGTAAAFRLLFFSPPKHSNRVRRSHPLHAPPGKVCSASDQQQWFGLLAMRSLWGFYKCLTGFFCYLRPPLPWSNKMLNWYQVLELHPLLAAFRAGWLPCCFLHHFKKWRCWECGSFLRMGTSAFSMEKRGWFPWAASMAEVRVACFYSRFFTLLSSAPPHISLDRLRAGQKYNPIQYQKVYFLLPK